MVSVPFPTASQNDKYSEGGGRLINAYVEKLSDGRVVRRRVPGLKQLVPPLSVGGCRGMIAVGNTLLVAQQDRLFKVEKTGTTFTITDLGALAGSSIVYFARNNKAPTPDIVAVASGIAYLISPITGAAPYPDVNVGSPNSVVAQSGYFIFSYGDARMRHTELNGTAINTLDTAFAESRPDGLFRVTNYKADILAFGPASIEIWRNTGNPEGFAYTYVDTLERGLKTPEAVSGYEPGFSDYGMIWLGDDGIVSQMRGYQGVRISNHTIEREISRVVNQDSFAALSFVFNGHPCWALSCDEWTRVYDLTTGSWHERKSHLRPRWRASASVYWNGRWVIADAYTGGIYTVDETFRYEGDAPLPVTIISATMTGFPARSRWDSLEIDIMSGVGIAAGLNPVQNTPRVSVSWSSDGGVTFCDPLQREIGEQGNYSRDILINQLGLVSDRGAQVKIEISDPVDFTLFGAEAKFKTARN